MFLLQAMMKDQFANYVVQKVLETCDDQNRELILSRIKVHLNALKRYTYGKHIVARVEKLIAAGGEFRSPCSCIVQFIHSILHVSWLLLTRLFVASVNIFQKGAVECLRHLREIAMVSLTE